MTIPLKYSNHYVPVKYFLASCRALSDGRSGIMQLEKKLNSAKVLLSDWKVQWIGTCTISRTAIDLFRIDAKSCLNLRIREEIAAEWSAIKDNKEMHAIFWEFLRDERNNVIHQYQWRTYEAWMKPDGTFRENRLSLLSIEDDGARPILMMNDGPFKGQNSLDLLNESAGWVEERIFSAIRRAGFDPNEARNLGNFMPLPTLSSSILGGPKGHES